MGSPFLFSDIYIYMIDVDSHPHESGAWEMPAPFMSSARSGSRSGVVIVGEGQSDPTLWRERRACFVSMIQKRIVLRYPRNWQLFWGFLKLLDMLKVY
jgi:hypothetical protein